jgi:exodeoxyribonuclease III
MKTLRICTWNINALMPTLANIKLATRFRSLQGFLLFLGDIVCMQEVKLSLDKVTKEVACVDGYESFFACSVARKGYSGVTTWAATPSYSPLAAQSDCLSEECEHGGQDLDQEGRIVVTDHGSFVLINVYVPNVGDRTVDTSHPSPRAVFKARFLNALKKKADSYRLKQRSVIIVGDFNMALDQKDLHPCHGPPEENYGEEEMSLMRALTDDYVDCWRHLHPNVSNQFTVWEERTNARASNKGSRIDLVLVSKCLLDRVVSCEIISTADIPPKWSDHAAVVVTLKDVPLADNHPPIPTSSLKDKRWHSQRSITSMFAPKPKTNEAAAGSSGVGVKRIKPPESDEKPSKSSKLE